MSHGPPPFQEISKRPREGMELITLSLVDGKVNMTRREVRVPNRDYKPPAIAKVWLNTAKWLVDSI